MKHRNRLTFYEFFAGGGMARAGLGDDWQCLFANDNCPKKADAYAANWGSEHLKLGDIEKVTASDLPEKADLVWASFPCQDLSLAGSGAGLKGERSGTFWALWKLIKSLSKQGRKPSLVVLENVYGAITSHGGKDFESIAKAIAANGYLVGAMVMDAVHFLPQSRPRLFIVAADPTATDFARLSRDTPNPAWHPDAVIRAYNRLPKALKEGAWRWWDLPAPSQRLGTLDEIIERNPQDVKWNSEADNKRILSMMTGLNRRKVMAAQAAGRLKVGTIYRRTRLGVQRAEVRFDGISGCLRTPSGGSSRQTIIVVEGAKVRTRLLSSREAARLMGLPESYKLPQRYNDAYHLAGDGVVVPVVAHLAQYLLRPLAMRATTRMRVTA